MSAERAQAGGGGMPRPEPHEHTEHQFHDECFACPVGSLFAGMDGASPDMMEHLLAAAHELLQVARSAIDAAEAVVQSQREARTGTGRTESRVHRIDLD